MKLSAFPLMALACIGGIGDFGGVDEPNTPRWRRPDGGPMPLPAAPERPGPTTRDHDALAAAALKRARKAARRQP